MQSKPAVRALFAAAMNASTHCAIRSFVISIGMIVCAVTSKT